MALKKSDLYASIWSAADLLRGGMDASQYKDYVLTLLFMRYVTDRAGQADALIELPPPEVPEADAEGNYPDNYVPPGPDGLGYGGSFRDMVFWKGKAGIGENLNKIVARFARHNGLSGAITTANFNDPEKVGQGQEMVERLSDLIGVFQKDELDMSGNRAGGDDLLGDAYEYLMRHFAQDSGKSKGQFYTPAEVSRVMAAIVGVERARTADFSAYDPTRGSGSLLLKVAAKAPVTISLFGQEKDIATTGLAVMNMWLHGEPTAEIENGNTLANPRHLNADGTLKRFDVIVANPPFSVKEWSQGMGGKDREKDFSADQDKFRRFDRYGVPPTKNGDFAFLLHILASLKTGGTAAVVLPHGVLFRGNAEASIRRKLIEDGVIKGIIGLPANLFYGTGIPACIIVLRKTGRSEEAAARQRSEVPDDSTIFLVDASRDFRKDGPKNRLRERDLHRIVDVFTEGKQEAGYSRSVPVAEIAANDYNLNLPRYLDGRDRADRQDPEGHLRGGIPLADVDALDHYWRVFPELRGRLFRELRPGYLERTAPDEKVTTDPAFAAYEARLATTFRDWYNGVDATLTGIGPDTRPAALIAALGESILAHYADFTLVDAYAVYQHLLDYWAETMQDDAYAITADGWTAELVPVMTGSGDKRKAKKGYFTSDLLPPEIVRDHFLGAGSRVQSELEREQSELETDLAALEEEEGHEDGLLAEVLSDRGKVTKGNLNARRKELAASDDEDDRAELAYLDQYKTLADRLATVKKKVKTGEAALRKATYAQYEELDEAITRDLVVNHKWYDALESRVAQETAAVGQTLDRRLTELHERYATPLAELEAEAARLTDAVNDHLAKLGLTW